MNTLYFVKLVDPSSVYPVVFCLTAVGPTEAIVNAYEGVNPNYRGLYLVDRVEIVCQTPNVVEWFEPV